MNLKKKKTQIILTLTTIDNWQLTNKVIQIYVVLIKHVFDSINISL